MTVEEKIYKLWEDSGAFMPRLRQGSGGQARRKGKPFVVAIPPPNITGSLHMGHALNSTIQDIVVRYHRMQQEPTLWIPGTDHAGIATQNVVEKELKKQGLTRHDLGRKKFIKKVWQWKEKYGDLILDQLKKLGCSCDWSRTRFTLDKDYVKAVEFAFNHYYEKGWIYQGPRIVNWCPRCGTAISDIEVSYVHHKTKLWYIKYPLLDERGSTSRGRSNLKYVVVATTRPETMLGDTAVAVNPKDKRYKNLVGKKVILPLINREIPIIADYLVDLDFGTGAVKITPAHDVVDNKIGKIHKLETINVIGEDGKMTKEAKEYAGLKTLEARKKIVETLKMQNLLEKEEDYEHSLAICDRCGTPIEPLISKQWFLKMEKLVKPAIKVVKENKIKFIPARYKKIYLDWMKNVEDWCISRQLWWGHQLPVWFCKNQTGRISNFQFPISKQIPSSKSQVPKINFVVSSTKPKKCPFCKKCEMSQSDDVLDTWFSSALWPFAILGWPRKTKDFKTFYPTTFLTTARDIIYLWVTRMIFSSLEFCKTTPFKDVYVHSTILTLQGKRMSKSLGVIINPLDLIKKYGPDATRMGIIYGISQEQQAAKFDERNILAIQKFINKLSNINRFVAITTKQSPISNSKLSKNLSIADKWILSRLNTVIQEITEKIENYKLGEAAQQLYDFVWHEYADWYLEISKIQIKKANHKTIKILNSSLEKILKLLHPFIPFVTEKLWQEKNKENLLMVSKWPKADKGFIDKKAEKEFEKIKEKIIKIRKKNPIQKLQDILIVKKLI